MELTAELCRSILDCIPEGVYLVDSSRRIVFWNRGAEDITGYVSHEVIGRSCKDNLLQHCDSRGHVLCLDRCPLTATLSDGEPRTADIYLKHKMGHRLPVRVKAIAVRGAGDAIAGAVEVFEDITAHPIRPADGADNTRWRDALTGIASEELITAQLEAHIRACRRDIGAAGVLLFRVDRLTELAQQYGRDASILAIKTAAHALAICARHGDLVGRWEDDGCLGILDNAGVETLRHVGEELRALVAASSFQWWGDQVGITVSVGGTMIRTGDTVEQVLERVEERWNRSQEAGGNRVTLID
jgi:diguanylate cyclase (GGDEF)-like protein/PAS domain S-box-containing protein